VRLVADASSLVAELLRRRGRALVADPRLQIYVAEEAASETRHELARRTRIMELHDRLAPEAGARLLRLAIEALELSVTPVSAAMYVQLESTARGRVPRDPADWPTVALALAMNAAIWTADNDFLGCGLPTWTTETLLAYLADPDAG
jgi:predicted nucleic acid-binding protein